MWLARGLGETRSATFFEKNARARVTRSRLEQEARRISRRCTPPKDKPETTKFPVTLPVGALSPPLFRRGSQHRCFIFCLSRDGSFNAPRTEETAPEEEQEIANLAEVSTRKKSSVVSDSGKQKCVPAKYDNSASQETWRPSRKTDDAYPDQRYCSSQ